MKTAKACFIVAVAAGAVLPMRAEGPKPLVMLDMQIERNGSELAKPCISTYSGEEGVYKRVTEYIYPTEFGLQVAGTNGVYSWAVQPQSFTMREVGVLVEATPTIAEGMVDLKLRMSIVDEPTWKDYGCTPTVPDGMKKKLPMELPFFKCQTMDNNRLLLQPGTPTTIQSDGVAITVTPRIVNAAHIAADTAKSAEAAERMKAMRLPEVSFKPPATIVDAVEFFRGASKDFDSPDIPKEKRGFNFVLRLKDGEAPVVPMIAASDISLYDALKIVCESVGYEFTVSGGIVIVKPKGVKP